MEAPPFVLPDLRAIDTAVAEIVACTVWEDVRPFQGLAGLIDWRLAGRLSVLAKSGFLTGARGEVLLVPSVVSGRAKLPFDKVLVLGLGPRATFDDAVARAGLARIETTLDGLGVKRALVELPGRANGELEAERAAELLRARTLDQAWTLVDGDDAEAAIASKLLRRPIGARAPEPG